jgi:hypothetical protein
MSEHPRPVVLAAMAIAVVVTAIATSAPPASARRRVGPCDLRRQRSETLAAHERELIHCATNHWKVFGGYRKALCIAKRESGLDPKAVSPDGDYLGLYQHAKRYWPGRYAAFTKPQWELKKSALIGRTNAIVSIRMVHDAGWDPWRGSGCAV